MIKYEKGQIVKGKITGIESYGAFITFENGYTGLIHISEISHKYVRNINDFVKKDDEIYAEILDLDDINLRLKLSMKNIYYRDGKTYKKKKIIETEKGFSTLKYKLPFWIEENVKKIKNRENTIDK